MTSEVARRQPAHGGLYKSTSVLGTRQVTCAVCGSHAHNRTTCPERVRRQQGRRCRVCFDVPHRRNVRLEDLESYVEAIDDYPSGDDSVTHCPGCRKPYVAERAITIGEVMAMPANDRRVEP